MNAGAWVAVCHTERVGGQRTTLGVDYATRRLPGSEAPAKPWPFPAVSELAAAIPLFVYVSRVT